MRPAGTSAKCDANGYSIRQSLLSVSVAGMRRYVLDNDGPIRNTYHNLEQVSSILWPAAMPSLTVENYVKAIYQLSHDAADGAIATGQISAGLGVLPGTVTSMLKTPDERNLAKYTPDEGVRLTPSGR